MTIGTRRADALDMAEGGMGEIPTIYERARRLLAVMGGAEAGRDDDEDEDGGALDELADVALKLCEFRSSGLDEVARKIAFWRALAPEEVLCVESAPTDGKLLLSILSDVTVLAGREHD